MAQSGNRPFVRRYRYYEILEVSRNATQDEIRRAYLKLAKIYHPDVNPDAKAHEKFKKINETYEILSDPSRRSSYDNSPAECPVCWTHEVIQTTEIHWRCRHCGCKFDPSRVSEIIEQVEKAAIPERLRNVLRIFQTAQCSWCRKFYTQPFLCPYSRLQSSCVSYDRLGNEERGHFLGDEKWWWRMADMIQQVQKRGIMAKCRECGALNPNPQKTTCWQCGQNTLCCPGCREAPILRYDIERDFWKCPNASHGKKYVIKPKKRVVEPVLSQEICPNCGKNLYYDAESLLWRCRNCRRIYTHQDLESERVHQKAGPRETEQTRPRAEHSHRSAKKPRPRAMRVGPGARKFLMSVTKLLLCLLVIAGISIIAWTGYRLFTHQIAPVIGTIVLLVEIGLLIWIISVFRSSRFKWRKPSFKLVFWSLVAITLVCAFAGIEPMSSAKDRVINFIEQGWETITTSSQSPTPAPVKQTPTPAPPSTSTKVPVYQHEQLVQYALDLINKDRVDNGLAPVILGSNTAAQKHAEDMLKNNYFSHWGMDGLKPYMRYTLEGGYNYEAENGFVVTSTGYAVRDPKVMLNEAENSLMGSSGHKRNILNEWHKKVNIGIAYDNADLFLVQQFEGDYIKFSQLPVLRSGILSATGETIGVFVFDNVQIWYDQPTHPLTIGQLDQTYAYNVGMPVAFLRLPAPPNSFYPENQTQYTWESQGIDPYSVSPDIQPTPNLSGIRPLYPIVVNSAIVKWVTASQWNISGNSFAIQANLNDIISQYGKGVYTVYIWGKIGGESVVLSNYSIFIE